jgi:hypothetical protein
VGQAFELGGAGPGKEKLETRKQKLEIRKQKLEKTGHNGPPEAFDFVFSLPDTQAQRARRRGLFAP